MKLGIISDIHANLKALEDVYNQLSPQVDNIICLGDIVDGGGEDDRCIEFIKGREIPCVCGGHDSLCIRINHLGIKEENISFLKSLPETMIFKNIFFVHDNPLDNARKGKGMWSRNSGISGYSEAKMVFDDFELFKEKDLIVAVGHTHRPAAYSQAEEMEIEYEKPIKFEKNTGHIINPGAVGYSRQKKNSANFGIIDTDNREFMVCKLDTKDIFSK